MVRWRLCLALAIMLLLPVMTGGKNSEDDDDEDSENKEDYKVSKISKPKYAQNSRRSEDAEEEDDDEEEDEDEGGEEKSGNAVGGMMERPVHEMLSGRRAPMAMATPKSVAMADPRVSKKRPLECFVCAYKSETPLRACLDPTKFRVHTITCHSVDDRCFTSVMSKADTYEAVVRGCRSGCVGSLETTCCDVNRCNNQAFALPAIQARTDLKPVKPLSNRFTKCFPPSVMFFITVLLLLQTVGRVALV